MEINTIESFAKIFFLITATVAVFTQVASNDRIAHWMGLNQSKMRSRHRYFGWVSLFGFMSLLFWGGYSPAKASGVLDRLLYLHIPLLLICTAVILFIAYKEERSRITTDGFLKISWMLIFILGSLFSIDVFALFIRRFRWFSEYRPQLQTIPYSLLVFAHAGIAFGIVIIRNLQVREMSGRKTFRFWAANESTQPDS